MRQRIGDLEDPEMERGRRGRPYELNWSSTVPVRRTTRMRHS